MIRLDKISLHLESIKFISGALIVFILAYILQINFIVPVFLLSLFSYLKFSDKTLRLKEYRLLNLVFLFVLIFWAAYLIVQRGWSLFYIPFSLVPMLAMILFGRLEITLLLTLGIAVTVAASAGGNYYLAVLFLTSGISSGLLVKDVRRRSSLIRAGLYVGLIQAIALFSIERFSLNAPLRYLALFLNGFGCSIIVAGILPVFEYLFRTVTNISLLELADFNRPLLQRMILEAPGTYHHSLIVGNLSEAAAQAVGAHALLSRVGSYYHDIGKLSKPEYFSENQSLQASKHDDLSPTMSKLIIMNHVKEGLELAKKHRLNPRLWDFIQQHHGKALVYYFYRRALENLEEDQQIKEEGFRYPGPTPNTKETAIVLLADSAEAATRAMKDPTPGKIKELVHKVINNKFIDGQLDDCDLTLKDLEIISSVFIHILSGIYHSRVSYPEEQRSENNRKKFPKEDSRQSEKDKKSNP